MNTLGKIVPLGEVELIVEGLRQQDKKIVTTNGAFDILHVGHKRALEVAKALGDVLIVGVNSDSSVKQYKSDRRPIVPEAERAEMLASLECVDYVTIFSEPDPKNFLRIVKPAIHTKSGDYKAEELKETPLIREQGGEVVIIPYVAGISTTNIIDKIIEVYKK